MLFKNLFLYRLSAPWKLTAQQLQEKLLSKHVKPCPKTVLSTLGWCSPFDDDSDVLVHACNGALLFCATRQERLLPASVINDNLVERVRKIEHSDDRRVYGKERKTLRDQIIFDLMPQAFVKKTTLLAYYEPQFNALLINSSSANRAEELTLLLRETLGSLALQPLEATNNPQSLMTHWLHNQRAPDDFIIDDACEMWDAQRGTGIIKCQKQDLFTPEVTQHLQAGKQVKKLALRWQEKLAFVLNEDLSLSRIRYLDLFQEQADEAQSAAELLDVHFALMSGEFRALLTALFAALGGLSGQTSATTQDNIVQQLDTATA